MSSSNSALAHLRVLDLSRILAGPWATQMLGDLGAEIIKVERPNTGDDTRSWGPPFIDEAGAGGIDFTSDSSDDAGARSAYFCSVNRNKRSLALDITTSQGAAIIRELAAKSDILVENFKVGGLAKYGLDYASLKAINPKLVYCSITGFGQDGPDAHRAGYDFMIQGMGGLMSITGETDGMPMKVGVALADVLTGTNAATAILAAVMHAERTGTGQHIDMSLFDVSIASLANQALNYLVTDNVPQRLGNAHPNIVPYQAFATSDGHLILAVGNDRQFSTFCTIAGCPELADNPDYATNRARVNNREALIPLVADAIAKQTTNWWLEALGKSGVPAGPINDIGAALAEPQAQHRQLASSITGDDNVQIPTVASPLRLGETPPVNRFAAPLLGEHSRQILTEILGYDDAVLERLEADKIITVRS